MNERGTSLVELIIVMGLVGLMTVFAAEGFVAAASRQQGHVTAVELASELRAVRFLALLRRERLLVRFEPDGRKMVAERADAPGLPIREYDYRNKNVALERLSNGPSILFYPNGRAATPTTITLRNNRHEQWQLTVSLTGKVSIQ
jgi:type II secretory pathway pseudopilin PulG